MTVNKRARCPICGRETATFTHAGTRIYVHHHNTRRGRASILADPDVCEASGWLVEDDELVVTPRKPNRANGVAQPPKGSWHCANGTGCKRSAPCSDLCRTIPDAPPVRPQGSVVICPRCTGYGQYEGDDCRVCQATGTVDPRRHTRPTPDTRTEESKNDD